MSRLERLRAVRDRAHQHGDAAPAVSINDLEALLAVATAARFCGEPGWCLVEPPCGSCHACALTKALATLDAEASVPAQDTSAQPALRVRVNARYRALIDQLGRGMNYRHGWKKDVADQLGIDPTHLTKIRGGVRGVSLETAETAITRLGLSPDYFTRIDVNVEAPRDAPSRTAAILAELARDDLKASLERLHTLGWRLTTAGGDTVDRLALVHLTTGARMPVWSAPVPVPDREREASEAEGSKPR